MFASDSSNPAPGTSLRFEFPFLFRRLGRNGVVYVRLLICFGLRGRGLETMNS
jgi:hypothetical protein